MITKDEAEGEIFRLQNKANLYLLAGNTEELKHIQLKISELQKTYGAFYGAKKENPNGRTV